MDLILWRHAEAREGSPDLTRPLTRKGCQQAKEMAEFLNLHLAKNTQVWTSEATRSIETAAYLNRPSQLQAALNPTADYSDILPLLMAEHKQPLLVVGSGLGTLHDRWCRQRRLLDSQKRRCCLVKDENASRWLGLQTGGGFVACVFGRDLIST